ncbi:pyridoxal 4-dehydrogenase [Sphingomonas sp. Sph1(2015)]|jgi:D-threo-aldose 1-dehydrogenase|uniref:aldo/keto reductase n=1 Tax=Sphingomonas sp. Sph1(2015) TaxID=1628084 RepID=UPI000976D27B|nr:aldo/keto reductase [Sphingomonas sp. Sph1(2015)]OMJ32463.1 pyridoxal 4-dehydrogenase [Sphingomonas sp. Sph1(2015)]
MTDIPRRKMGRTDCALPELGFGAAAMGNLYAAIDDASAAVTLDAALSAGFRYFDTAPHYGRGLSERRLGDALRGRGDVIVSTKVGRLMDPDASITDDRERDGFHSAMPFSPRYDYSYDGILRSHEHSLQRLGLARVDMLFVHDIGRVTHGEADARYCEQLITGGGFRALESLRDQGAISGFGLGVNEVEVCLDLMEAARFDVILLAGRYTLLEQGALDALFPACAAAGTSIVVGGPYNSGILATGSAAAGRYNYAPAPEAVLTKVRALEAVAARHHVSLPAAALAFVLAHPLVASVIPGIADPQQVSDTMRLYAEPIPSAFWTELRDQGLVRPDAPLPGEGA